MRGLFNLSFIYYCCVVSPWFEVSLMGGGQRLMKGEVKYYSDQCASFTASQALIN